MCIRDRASSIQLHWKTRIILFIFFIFNIINIFIFNILIYSFVIVIILIYSFIIFILHSFFIFIIDIHKKASTFSNSCKTTQCSSAS